MTLVFRRLDSPLGQLMVAATDSGVCRVAFPAEVPERWSSWFVQHFGASPRPGSHRHLDCLVGQLEEYWEGGRNRLEVPLDLHGTPFQLLVWRRLLEVPYGSTVTYGELADELGISGGARAIGGASASNPVPILVPCHRLVGSSGQLVGFSGGLELKERLLELEGARIPFGAL